MAVDGMRLAPAPRFGEEKKRPAAQEIIPNDRPEVGLFFLVAVLLADDQPEPDD